MTKKYQGPTEVRGQYASTEPIPQILDRTLKRLTDTQKNFENRLQDTIKELQVKVKNIQLDKNLNEEDARADSEIQAILLELQIYRDYKKIVSETLTQYIAVLTNAGDIVKSIPNLKEPYRSYLKGFIYYSEPYSLFLQNVFNRGEARIKLAVKHQTGTGKLSDLCRYVYPFQFNQNQFEGRLSSRPKPDNNPNQPAQARVIVSITDPNIAPNVLTLRIDRTERVVNGNVIMSQTTGEPESIIMLDFGFKGVDEITGTDTQHPDYKLRMDLSNRLFKNTRRQSVRQTYHLDLVNPLRNPGNFGDESWTMDRFALFATLIEDRSI